jgi:hypothetical protein
MPPVETGSGSTTNTFALAETGAVANVDDQMRDDDFDDIMNMLNFDDDDAEHKFD